MPNLVYRLLVAFLTVLLSFIQNTSASESPIDRLRQTLTSTTSFSAGFSQEAVTENGLSPSKSEGIFLLQKPGKFRWDYKTPYRQTIVSNGVKVSFYDADLEQVTVKKLSSAIGSTPALLLSGRVELDKDFVLEALGPYQNMSWVKLVPKSEDNTFKYIKIGMRDNTLGAMEMGDNFGQLTRIYFSDVKTNTAIDPAEFELEPPPGVDVFEEQ